MASIADLRAPDLVAAIERGGFAFVHGDAMRDLLAPFGSLSDWAAFADSWNRLELDTYMADGGRYRRRRHAIFTVAAGRRSARAPHQPHFQTVDYNPLNGGVARWFEPIEDRDRRRREHDDDPRVLPRAVRHARAAAPPWRIEVHQFRIEARAARQGRPTPEGLHRDGVDYVLVLLVNRRNIASGITTIHALDGEALGQFTLTDPFDAALVDDTRVAHGVTPVEPLDRRSRPFAMSSS